MEGREGFTEEVGFEGWPRFRLLGMKRQAFSGKAGSGLELPHSCVPCLNSQALPFSMGSSQLLDGALLLGVSPAGSRSPGSSQQTSEASVGSLRARSPFTSLGCNQRTQGPGCLVCGQCFQVQSPAWGSRCEPRLDGSVSLALSPFQRLPSVQVTDAMRCPASGQHGH